MPFCLLMHANVWLVNVVTWVVCWLIGVITFHQLVVFSSFSLYSSVNGVQKITPSTTELSYFSIDLLNLDWSKCCWSIRQDCSLYTAIVLLYPKSYQDSTVKNSVAQYLILSIISYTFDQVFKTLLRQKVKLSTVPPVKT